MAGVATQHSTNMRSVPNIAGAKLIAGSSRTLVHDWRELADLSSG